ncbi:MAG: type VI secretion system contractile sheath small subunit [Planctomycetota bacterium]|nr:MAG: type VI secretion system contractile sheath small subunit [Planctomycetota bacterium]
MKQQSKAPKERINITYRPATNTKEQKELPFRMAMLGDFTLRPDDTPLEERKMLRVDKDNFNDVMKSQNLELTVNVKNKLTGNPDDELGVKLNFATLKDFEPEQIARQVPELAQLLETREALNSLKAPLANKRAFQKKVMEIVKDEETRNKLLAVLKKAEQAAAEGDAAESGDGGGDAGGEA